MTILEKLTIEMLYYGYINIMPRSYINNYNRIFRDTYIYFHSGVIANKEIIYVLKSITSDIIKRRDILNGLAYSGRLESQLCCEFLLKTDVSLIDCAKNNTILEAVASVGNMKILKWLLRRYKFKVYGSLKCALDNGHIDIFNFLADTNRYYSDIIRNYHINMIIEIHNQNYFMDDACEIAAMSDKSEILKWLRSKNYPFDDNVCYSATGYGHFDIVKWLYEKRMPIW